VKPALRRIDFALDTAWKGVGDAWINETSSFAYVLCVAVKGDMTACESG
jgi:hypothetical protein